MKLFWKEKPKLNPGGVIGQINAHGLSYALGDVMQHRVTKDRCVIVKLFNRKSGRGCAMVSRGWFKGDQYFAFLAELEPVTPTDPPDHP